MKQATARSGGWSSDRSLGAWGWDWGQARREWMGEQKLVVELRGFRLQIEGEITTEHQVYGETGKIQSYAVYDCSLCSANNCV